MTGYIVDSLIDGDLQQTIARDLRWIGRFMRRAQTMLSDHVRPDRRAILDHGFAGEHEDVAGGLDCVRPRTGTFTGQPN